MSREALLAIEHLAELQMALPGEIHPSGRVAIVDWLQKAQRALDVGDNVEAARLIRSANQKAATELGWYAEALKIGADVVAEVRQRAARGDILGAAARLREADRAA
jgi:hypothetical protein